jgi:hypothetical protein
MTKFSTNYESYLINSESNKFNIHVTSGASIELLNSNKVTNTYSMFSSLSVSKSDFSENNAYRNYVLDSYPNANSLFLESNLLKIASANQVDGVVHSSSHDSINVNFLRKERLYTKLKYSRSPAYDIVSGGAAAILAGFLGFLISEKYGFELVDSGDFYFFFMYIVFFSFSVRPLLTSVNYNAPLSSLLSVKPLLKYYLNLLYLTYRK